MRSARVAVAVFAGAFASTLLIVAQGFYESAGKGSEYAAWLALPLPIFETIVLLVPGLVAGWLACAHRIVAGCLAGSATGALLYYSGPIGHGVPVDESHATAYLSASVFVYVCVGALVGAVSGAASTTLRSNNRVQPTCEDARG
jgi:hypothetical protein